MACTLRQAFSKAIDRINRIEELTLDKEYNVINSYKVVREELDMDQQDAMLQLIEHCIGETKLSDQEYDRLEKLVFSSSLSDPEKKEPETIYTILEWDWEANSSTEWVQASDEETLQEYAQCIQDGVSEDEPLMDMLISVYSNGEHEILSFNTYCRKHGIWRPSQRESQEAFRASMERVAGLI